MIWYFAYGSNMNPARLKERLEPEGVAMAAQFQQGAGGCAGKRCGQYRGDR
jgi:hypothetical protein